MKIAVSAVSFSKNEVLRNEILAIFPQTYFNVSGKILKSQDLVDFFADSKLALVGTEKIDENVLKSCPNLQFISKYGVGLDNIDLEACQKYGVQIGWTGGVNRLSVAEMVLGFMLASSRNLFSTSLQLKNGIWNKNGGFQLSKKTVGIIGVGCIGKELVRLLKPFDCTILVNDIVEQSNFYKENNLLESSKEEIFQKSDFISIHTPLSPLTKQLICEKSLSLMKKNAFLINTSRGEIVKQDDLHYFLKNNLIGGAALDVYEEEPCQDLDFLTLPNLICTPHIGGNAQEAVLAMGRSAIEHLKSFC